MSDLVSKVTKKLVSNYSDVDPFYPKASQLILKGFVSYLEPLYENNLTEEIVIQELLKLLPVLSYQNMYLMFLFGMQKNTKDESWHSIFFASDKAKNDMFSYLTSAIVEEVALGTIVEDKNFKSKIDLKTVNLKIDEQ